MDFRALILDDNHSFVDLLKMRLGKFPLYFDTAFRHEQASLQIQEHGSFFSPQLVEEVKKAVTQLEEWINNSVENAQYPKLNKKLMTLDSIVNPSGYLVMIIEDKVERLPKGVEFIQNVISVSPCFQHEDFMLFVDNSRKLSSLKESTIPTFLKDVRNTGIYEFVNAKVSRTRSKVQELEELFKKFSQLRQEFQRWLAKMEKSRKSKKISKEITKSTHRPKLTKR